MNICLSHTATMSVLTKLGINHDEAVNNWRDQLCNQISENKQVWVIMKKKISIFFIYNFVGGNWNKSSFF